MSVDGGLDAAPACAVDEDCEDDVWCNGVARCADGRCVVERADCDDGVACTEDVCSEELRGCAHHVIDMDGDGVGSLACVDARGVPLGNDCDDADARRFPGARELCDALHVDEDCDPSTLGARDEDGDGHVDRGCCNGASCGDDCNDALRGVSPDAIEVCDGLDDDCDGAVDEHLLELVYRDADGDGHGDASSTRMACPTSSGWVTSDDDCDDGNAARSPALFEACDGIDNDCDGTPDPVDAPDVVSWYEDHDGDGFGDARHPVPSCAPPGAGFSLLGTDCDDTDPARHPGQAESCNGVDDDCNARADYELAPGDTEDDDLDGAPDAHCRPAPAADRSDCDDLDASSTTGASEICDGRDNDCDGTVDEGVTSTTYFRDADLDGWGSEVRGAVIGCGSVPGYTVRAGDCDDADDDRHPGRAERCDGGDQDCDGYVDEDLGDESCTWIERPRECIAGACRDVLPCASPFADCDGIVANGCETDLSSDAFACGLCRHRCPHGSACVDGACDAATACTPPLLDCDGDGVCTDDSRVDPHHCGSCARDCAEPHASATCALGTCGAPTCDLGHSDCNADLGLGGDGCETASASCAAAAWARTLGGPGDDHPSSAVVVLDVAAGSANEVYVAAGFRGTVTLAGVPYTSGGFGTLLFSLDASGGVRWARELQGGMADATADRIVARGSSVFVGATLSGTGTVALSGTAVATLSGVSQPLVLALSATDGSISWTRLLPTTMGATLHGLDASSSGATVVLAGSYVSDLMPGAPAGALSGTNDGYVVSLDGATGSSLASMSIGGPGLQDLQAIDYRDLDGNVLVGGNFDGATWMLGPTTLTAGGGSDGFAARCSLVVMTCSQVVVISTAHQEQVTDVRDATALHWIVSGVYQASTTVGTRLVSGATIGGFVAGVSYPRGIVDWATGHGSSITVPDGIRRIALDGAARIRVAFGAGAGGSFASLTVPARPHTTPYVFVLDADTGGYVSSTGFTATADTSPLALTVRTDGATVLAGEIAGASTIAGAPLTTAGGWDVFVADVGPP
ncbi:MAG: hypothetical protein K1X94_17260 [Sandaracinaceae bacterium]|nr:hypothetical protein [Sandaracinaceae bacterium]